MVMAYFYGSYMEYIGYVGKLVDQNDYHTYLVVLLNVWRWKKFWVSLGFLTTFAFEFANIALDNLLQPLA